MWEVSLPGRCKLDTRRSRPGATPGNPIRRTRARAPRRAARAELARLRQRRGVGEYPHLGFRGWGWQAAVRERVAPARRAYAPLLPHKRSSPLAQTVDAQRVCVESPTRRAPYGSVDSRTPRRAAKWRRGRATSGLIAEANMPPRPPGRPAPGPARLWRLGQWERERLARLERRAARQPHRSPRVVPHGSQTTTGSSSKAHARSRPRAVKGIGFDDEALESRSSASPPLDGDDAVNFHMPRSPRRSRRRAGGRAARRWVNRSRLRRDHDGNSGMKATPGIERVIAIRSRCALATLDAVVVSPARQTPLG